METGKTRRTRRIFRSDNRTVIVPMDHGVSVGPIPGLKDMPSIIALLAKSRTDAVLVHAGIARTTETHGMGLIVHLSGATRLSTEPNWKAQVTSVKDSIRLGADAVSVHINVGSPHEQSMLEAFSRVSDECNEYGVPTLAMMYPRGPNIRDEHAHDQVAHAARLGYEIGADIVKTNFTGDVESFREIVQSVRVPIVVAGGPRAKNDYDVLRMVAESIEAGASGVSIGRNIFQHEDPAMMSQALASLVHDRIGLEKAAEIVGAVPSEEEPGGGGKRHHQGERVLART